MIQSPWSFLPWTFSLFLQRMPFLTESYLPIINELSARGITLVAVSKTKPAEDILEAYKQGQRDFGENYVQELVAKEAELPKDIRWHFIGHLQKNKVKYIAPFVHLIHGVDSEALLLEINKQGKKINRVIPCLLQVYIAGEESKFGMDDRELHSLLANIEQNPSAFSHISIKGLMGMASFTDDIDTINREFRHLKELFDATSIKPYWKDSFKTLSMGMSADYTTAIQNGSNLVRIGSLIFGERNYTN